MIMTSVSSWAVFNSAFFDYAFFHSAFLISVSFWPFCDSTSEIWTVICSVEICAFPRKPPRPSRQNMCSIALFRERWKALFHMWRLKLGASRIMWLAGGPRLVLVRVTGLSMTRLFMDVQLGTVLQWQYWANRTTLRPKTTLGLDR